MITPVCQSFWWFSTFPHHLTHPCTLLCSMPSLFQLDFIFTNSFTDFNLAWLLPLLSMWRLQLNNMCQCAALTGFNKSSKYSINHERISFSSLRMIPDKSLMEGMVFKLFLQKQQMVPKSIVGIQPTTKFLPRVFLGHFISRAAALALQNIGIANQMMTCFAAVQKASFFAQLL